MKTFFYLLMVAISSVNNLSPLQSLPTTESQNPTSHNLDELSIPEIRELMNRSNMEAAQAVANAHKQIDEAIDQVVHSFKTGGRLFYVGAGTSGRLGILDASECPPTFSANPEMVQGIIAGGDVAIRKSVEGAEDNAEQAIIDLTPLKLQENDIVIGISANGSAPYVLSALNYAKSKQSKTVLITCNSPTVLNPNIDHYIVLLVGPEIITGSTRLKAGTATKMVLNEITTIAMVQLGKVYGNLMVDLRIWNKKLVGRAYRIIKQVLHELGAEISDAEIDALLPNAHQEVKTAIVMFTKKCTYEAAKQLLEQNNGSLRKVLATLS